MNSLDKKRHRKPAYLVIYKTLLFFLKEAYASYDPVLYTKPIEEYPEEVRLLIDLDYIE